MNNGVDDIIYSMYNSSLEEASFRDKDISNYKNAIEKIKIIVDDVDATKGEIIRDIKEVISHI